MVWDTSNQVVHPEENLVVPQVQDSGNKEKRDAELSKATPVVEDPPRSFVPKAPYPETLQAPRKGGKFGCHPASAIICQVLKGLDPVKWRTNIPKNAFLNEQVSSILQCKLPIKYKDSGCPTTSCMIEVTQIERALLDLEARV
jgi:hypothetical protein